MAVESPPAWLQAGSYGAEQTRRTVATLLQRGATIGSITGGIVGAGDCLLSPPGSGMSVNVAPGELWVPGSSSATQSGYYARVSSSTSLAIAASNPTNPRIDLVCGTVQDAAYAGGSNAFLAQVLTGTPTAGATLVNLNGAPALPASSLALGYVLVPANATNIIAADLLSVPALVADASPTFATVAASGSTSAVSGQWVECTAGGITITLPTPVKNSTVAVTASASGISGSNQVTVAAGASGAINGLGLSAAASFKLGTPGAYAILVADGSNWWLVAGQQDTGWVALSLATNITSGGFGAAARLQGDTVRLKGTLTNGTGAPDSGTLATIPSGLRPSGSLTLGASTLASTPGSGSPVEIAITSAGAISLPAGLAVPGGGGQGTLSLDSVTFTLS